jgi:hypothetical protein
MKPVPSPIRIRIRTLLRKMSLATASQNPEVNTLNIPYFEVLKGIENQRIYKHNLGLPFFKKKLNLLSDKMMN